MSNVYQMRRRRFPNDVHKLLEMLAARAKDDHMPLDGLAFIAYFDDHGYIADAVGTARLDPEQTKAHLKVLERRLERLKRT